MEGENVEMGGSSGAQASSRWNPTKEQISMLEGLYRQGIRTPSAEQIQQITSRLKAYGHIEGKNVFYWFQNHKARQRQKQKQESMAYINRFLHKTQPVYPPPFPNVVCPYYLPQSELGFYPQYPKVLLPGGFKRKPRTEKMEKTRSYTGGSGYEHANQDYSSMMQTGNNNGGVMNNSSISNQETLDLFPLHPTDIVKGKTASSSVASTSAEGFTTPTSSETTGIEGSGDQPFFFDFFSGLGFC